MTSQKISGKKFTTIYTAWSKMSGLMTEGNGEN